MVFLRRITSRRLCDFVDRNDHLVSIPIPLPKRQADLLEQIPQSNTPHAPSAIPVPIPIPMRQLLPEAILSYCDRCYVQRGWPNLLNVHVLIRIQDV